VLRALALQRVGAPCPYDRPHDGAPGTRRRRAVTDYAAFARLGVATVHEAAGQTGIVDLPLTQVVPGSRVAGPARIALCAPQDNTMVHALIADAKPGDILVLTSARPTPHAFIGELLATQAQKRGVAGFLVDAAVRDFDELVAIGLPVWARWVRAQGPTKGERGELDVLVVVGNAEIRPGDLVVMDCDGAMALPAARVDEVLPLALERERRESEMRQRYAAGELSYEVQGIRKLFEDG
jgi:4-hydroxy-4-methyl-2-oxoglutarate aldolase